MKFFIYTKVYSSKAFPFQEISVSQTSFFSDFLQVTSVKVRPLIWVQEIIYYQTIVMDLSSLVISTSFDSLRVQFLNWGVSTHEIFIPFCSSFK